MNPIAILGAVGAFVVVTGIFVGIYLYLRRGQQVIEARLEQYARDGTSADAKDSKSREKGPSRLTQTLDRQLADRGFAANIATQLARADLKLTVSEYLALIVISVIGCALLALLIFRIWPLAIVGGIVGIFLPSIWTKIRHRRRLNAFNNQLVDTINLLANSLRSGYSMLQSMETVAKELPPPISTEFKRVTQEIALGLSQEQAMANLLRRINSDDLDLMITAINVQHEVGGNLAEILEIIGHTIRERVRIKGEIRVLTAQGMITGYVISGLPVFLGLILFLLNREYMGAMFKEPCGWIMLGVGAVIIVSGFLIIQKIVRIEV